MKKICLVLVIALVSVMSVKAQTNWINRKIDEKISVKFPSEPTEAGPGSLMAINTSKSLLCIVTVVDFKTLGLDERTLDSLKNTPEFTEQVIEGLRNSMSNVKLADLTVGKWNGFTSYTTNGTDATGKVYNMLMIIIAGKMYSATSVAEASALKEAAEFRSGITVNGK